MNQIALNLSKMPVHEKIAFAWRFNDALLEHADTFPDPPVSTDDFVDMITAFQGELDSLNAARGEVRLRNSTVADTETAIDNALRRLGLYVQTVAAGDAATIELAGINVRERPARIGQLHTPVGLVVTADRNPGTVTLRWRVVRNARNYIVQYAASLTLPETFPNEASVTRARLDLAHLQSATRYWFRVAALGTAGPSYWTDAVSVVTQ